MTTYDPSLLTKHADTLYSRANRLLAQLGFLGLVGGAGIGFVADSMMRGPDNSTIVVGIPSVLGMLIGIAVGSERAFRMKLEAQVVLCQLQTEINTRPRAAPPQAQPIQS